MPPSDREAGPEVIEVAGDLISAQEVFDPEMSMWVAARREIGGDRIERAPSRGGSQG